MVLNRLTPPGGIRKVAIQSDIVRVNTSDGRVLIYQRTTSNEDNRGGFGNVEEYPFGSVAPANP